MEEFQSFVKNNLIDLIIITISLLSFLLSFFTLWVTRKTLDVSIEDELTYGVTGFYVTDEDCHIGIPNFVFNPALSVCYIKVVNPSPNDIAFFDFRIINNTDSSMIWYSVKGNVGLKKSDDNTIYYEIDGNVKGRLNLLESNYGIFKSNSFTRFDIPIEIPLNCESITVSFKIAKRSLLSRPGSEFRKHFKYYSMTFKINNQ